METILVAGAAGFIGSKISQMLLEKGYTVIGLDNLNAYYNVQLKLSRLASLETQPGFKFYPVDIENKDALCLIFKRHCIHAVINEAARAGVRCSINKPGIYLSTNTGGSLNLLDCCKEHRVPKFILASTSSLYAGQDLPFCEDLPVNTPISPYAASKKAAEMMAYTYHYLYGIDVTVLRYFTVYGPAGRPDMSYFKFIKRILEGKPLEIFGDGSQSRDFTYVDDIARGTIQALSLSGYEVINLGNCRPVKLLTMIQILEKYTGKEIRTITKPFDRSDMRHTWADISKAEKLLNWRPQVSLEEGLKETVEWSLKNQDLMLP